MSKCRLLQSTDKLSSQSQNCWWPKGGNSELQCAKHVAGSHLSQEVEETNQPNAEYKHSSALGGSMTGLFASP